MWPIERRMIFTLEGWGSRSFNTKENMSELVGFYRCFKCWPTQLRRRTEDCGRVLECCVGSQGIIVGSKTTFCNVNGVV